MAHHRAVLRCRHDANDRGMVAQERLDRRQQVALLGAVEATDAAVGNVHLLCYLHRGSLSDTVILQLMPRLRGFKFYERTSVSWAWVTPFRDTSSTVVSSPAMAISQLSACCNQHLHVK